MADDIKTAKEIGALNATPTSLYKQIAEAKQARSEAMNDILAITEERGSWQSSERRDFDKHSDEVRRLEALEAKERNSVDYGQVIRTSTGGYDQQGRHTGGGHTYNQGDTRSSWLKDVRAVTETGDHEARERLARNTREVASESRAMADVDGTGGELVPPLWMINQLVTLARPGRVFADQVNGQPMPAGTDSINLPRITSGTSVAEQASQNSNVSDTTAETDSIAATVASLSGQQTISFQMIDQSPSAVDQVVLADLAAELAKQVDLFCLSNNATGKKGVLNVSGVNNVTYTTDSPTPAGLYSKIADAIQQISTNRFLPPDKIIMHPRRFAWLTAAVDSTNRPLVLPVSQSPMNVMGAQGQVVAEGLVGSLQGISVFVDANMPSNRTVGATGAGADQQDCVIVTRSSDLYRWESAPRIIADRYTLSNQLSLRLVLWSYLAIQMGRYPVSTSVISGTGLNAPTF